VKASSEDDVIPEGPEGVKQKMKWQIKLVGAVA